MTKPPTLRVPMDSIVIGERIRTDLGDIASLAESMRRVGLIQPIVLNHKNELIAGGRRFTAATSLEWQTIPAVYLETLDEHHLRILELEENLNRKEVTWQEHCNAVVRIHKLKASQAALEGKGWTHDQTADLIEQSQFMVSAARFVAPILAANPDKFKDCSSLTDAYKLLIRDKERLTQAELAKRTLSNPVIAGLVDQPELSENDVKITRMDGPVMNVDLRNQIINGNSIDWMLNSNPGICDHIVTDPPYGIDMEMLAQENTGMTDIDSVVDTHDVDENLIMFPKMFKGFMNVLKPDGYVILWCDVMNWQYLYDLATNVGFKVQRWPLTWVKTHTCGNQMANVNFTKSTEIAMVLRKGKPTLPKPIGVCHILASNEEAKKTFDHPFAKPHELWQFCIEAVSIQGQKILDPFAGRGSSTISCLRLARSPIAIELEEHHYNPLLINVKNFYTSRLGKVNFTL